MPNLWGTFYPLWLYHFMSPPAMEEDPSLFTSSSILVFHIFMCLSVCLHLLLSLEAREGIGSTTARVMGGCKMSCWHWELSKSSRCSSHWAITPALFITAVVSDHPYGYAVLFHCGFDWRFLLTVMLILSSCAVCCLCVVFRTMFVQVLCLIFNYIFHVGDESP